MLWPKSKNARISRPLLTGQSAFWARIAPVTLVAEERTLKGSYIGSAVPQRDVPRMIALFRAGRLPVDQLLTHRLKLDDINEGFDRLREGIGVRQVVMFE
jgi:alcohol dehydrogenase